MVCIWKLQPSLTCLFNEGFPKLCLIFMVRRNLEWRTKFGQKSFVNKKDPPFISISYVMVLSALFHYVFPKKVHANQGTRQHSTAFLMLPPSAASDKGSPGWVLPVEGWILLSAFSWESSSSSHTMVWTSMNKTLPNISLHWVFLDKARTSCFHQEPYTMMKWQAVAEMTASHHERPHSTEHGKLTKKILIENTFLKYIFACFLFPCRQNKIQRAQAETFTPN